MAKNSKSKYKNKSQFEIGIKIELKWKLGQLGSCVPFTQTNKTAF